MVSCASREIQPGHRRALQRMRLHWETETAALTSMVIAAYHLHINRMGTQFLPVLIDDLLSGPERWSGRCGRSSDRTRPLARQLRRKPQPCGLVASRRWIDHSSGTARGSSSRDGPMSLDGDHQPGHRGQQLRRLGDAMGDTSAWWWTWSSRTLQGPGPRGTAGHSSAASWSAKSPQPNISAARACMCGPTPRTQVNRTMRSSDPGALRRPELLIERALSRGGRWSSLVVHAWSFRATWEASAAPARDATGC
jgi:hypothetical protein